MRPQIHTARVKSATLRRLYTARQQVTELLYVLLTGDEFLTNPLKELLSRLDGKIHRIQSEIQGLLLELPGYNLERCIPIRFISQADINARLIDISTAEDGSRILDLDTGEIIVSIDQ